MKSEIVPAIPYQVDEQEAFIFSKAVLDRFANPYIQHQWINITFQYSMKMKIRILPVLLEYYKRFGKIPSHIAFGLAAYLAFMTVKRKDGEKYIGFFGSAEYVITDDEAPYFFNKLQNSLKEFPGNVLMDKTFWGEDLTLLPGLIERVEENYNDITRHGIVAGLSAL